MPVKKLYAENSAENAHIDGHKSVQTSAIVKNVASVINRIVGNTLGPAGRNYMTPLGITNDGVSILQEIRFSDEREDSVADAFEEIARRQDEQAGDGTTTATTIGTVLTPLVLDDVVPLDTPVPGMKNVMDIKRQLEEEAKEATSLLRELAVPVTTLEQLTHVAETAMEKHESSSLIAETVFKVGKDSNTSIREGFDGKVTTEVVPGIEYPLRIQTSSMFTNSTRKEATHENALVIVANHVFEAYSDLSLFMSEMVADKEQKKQGKQPIIIVGKHFSVQFTSQIVTVSKMTNVPILLLSTDGLKDDEVVDIAIFTGARFIETHPKEGKKFDLHYKDAGQVKEIIAGQHQTSFIGGAGLEVETLVHGEPETLVQARITDLNALAAKEQNDLARDFLKRRAAGLSGGIATIYVDAQTAVDRYYLKKKVEDAVNSCKAALDLGVVKGGGVALAEVATKMEENEMSKTHKLYLPTALRSINERIIRNAGGKLDIPETVLDAAYTNICAIENAVAVVKVLVTMEGVIADVDTTAVDALVAKLNA